MNTPRSKKRQRASLSTKVDAAFKGPALGGEWPAGIEHAPTAAAFGIMVTRWTHLEERMVGIYCILAGHEDESQARIVFRTIVSQNTRIDIMRELLATSLRNKNRSEDFDEIIDEFSRLNAIRNKYVHGLWSTHATSNRVFVQPAKGDSSFFQEKREIKIKEIDKICHEMYLLSQRIGKLLFGDWRKREEMP